MQRVSQSVDQVFGRLKVRANRHGDHLSTLLGGRYMGGRNCTNTKLRFASKLHGRIYGALLGMHWIDLTFGTKRKHRVIVVVMHIQTVTRIKDVVS